ncbi:protein encoded in hypervariable junctions of pilus gene clusters [Leptolyngbya sp. PCC 7375]|nr:protein encoded in hypervariable junctions of pilus gene clusters [Leptolyngbya sp. PCC 7375]
MNEKNKKHRNARVQQTEGLSARLPTPDYPITVLPAENGQFVATIKDLPGCVVQSSSPEEAINSVQHARNLWIASARSQGKKIPAPSTEGKYSGRVMLRMSPLLHKILVEAAQKENVSLNQYMITSLAMTAKPQLASEASEADDNTGGSASSMQGKIDKLLEDVQEIKRKVRVHSFQPSVGHSWPLQHTSSPQQVRGIAAVPHTPQSYEAHAPIHTLQSQPYEAHIPINTLQSQPPVPTQPIHEGNDFILDNDS